MESGAIVLRRWKLLLLGVLILANLAAGLMTMDDYLLERLTFPKRSAETRLAQSLSKWGDFQTGLILACGLTWAAGALAGNPFWRRAALAVLLAAVLGGIAANCLRLTVGRPRPSVGLVDGAYGPSIRSKYHGFASAHAATSFAAAGALTVICPPAGVVAVPAAVAVSWSRLQLRRHHPSDILVGGGLGLSAGVFAGLAFRNRLRRRRAFAELKADPFQAQPQSPEAPSAPSCTSSFGHC